MVKALRIKAIEDAMKSVSKELDLLRQAERESPTFCSQRTNPVSNLHPKTLAALAAGPIGGQYGETPQDFARRIAQIAMEEEREECAKVCEAGLYEADQEFLDKRGDEERVPYEVEQATLKGCADAIRRRGES